MSEEAEKVIRADAVIAKRFDLVDKEGETRLTMGTTPDKDVGVNFFDAQGTPRIVFAVQEDGNATISLVDHERKERIRISSGAFGNAVTMFDRTEHTRLLLQLDNEADGAEIHMVDESGKPQIVMSQIGQDAEKPAPAMVFKDSEGTTRAYLQSGPDESTLLTLYDRDGTLRVVLGLDDENEANLIVQDKYGSTRRI